ncbi:MAG: hypothetical protein WCF33_19540 [Pseudonocardiaceae bacterium]
MTMPGKRLGLVAARKAAGPSYGCGRCWPRHWASRMLRWLSYWKISPEPRQASRLRPGAAILAVIIKQVGMICGHSRREVILRTVGRI